MAHSKIGKFVKLKDVVGVIIEERPTTYLLWYGGTLNRKPCLYVVPQKGCKFVHKNFVYD